MKKYRAAVSLGILLISTAFPVFAASEREITARQQDASLPITEYRIGSKDLLVITVFELPELNQTVRVSEDGSISLYLIGKLDVAGLTSQELEEKLASLLNLQYTKNAHVTVFIKEYQKVAVLGAVARPGMYELVGPTTLLQIIAQAGGLTAQAMKDLFVFRQTPDGRQVKITIKLEDLMINGRQDLNIEIQPKDVITVPNDETKHVYVYGQVRTPGVISFLGSRKITLLQAIAQAGGPTDWAKKKNVTIKRKDALSGNETMIQINLNDVERGKSADIVLEAGDIVIIP